MYLTEQLIVYMYTLLKILKIKILNRTKVSKIQINTFFHFKIYKVFLQIIFVTIR